jgi:large subunit ribosomal protein L12
MEYIYGAMLLHAAGKEITDENLEKVLKAAGIEPDSVRIKGLTASLKDVNIDDAISTAAVVSAPIAAAPAAEGGGAAAPAAEEKKEEKKEEEEEVSEEEAAAGLGALFG